MTTIRFFRLESLMPVLLCTALAACGNSTAPSSALTQQQQSLRALYVSATAAAGGDGSEQAPFNSLTAVEAASVAGDTIIVLPSALDVPPLDGGIALKPGQRLIGGGAPVVQRRNGLSVEGSTGLSQQPRIRNTNLVRNSGDAVVLAQDTEVTNLVVTESFRGGIYGLNAPGVNVHGNDVSGHNTSCTIGFVVQPLTAPSNTRGIGATFALPSGWAAIMIDADHGDGQISVNDNYVHHGACGNGIDIRLSGTAHYASETSRNFVTELSRGPLNQSQELHLVHAMSLQTRDQSNLTANSIANTQTNIGSAGADCEGLFANPAGTSFMLWRVDQNHFSHGIGGFSCNGMELVNSIGGAHGEMYIANSSFEDNPGDMFEAANLGSNGTMILELDNVLIRDTTLSSGNDGPIPFNIGECILVGSSGAGNTTILRMRNSEASGCNNGVAAGSNVAIGNGTGPDKLLMVEIVNSRIHDNAFYNLVIRTFTELTELVVKVENTNLSNAGDSAVAFLQETGAITHTATIDLGGGALASAGRNCIFGGTNFDAKAQGYSAVLKNNWWGNPTGPAEGRTMVSSGGGLDFNPVLSAPSQACQ